MGEMGKEEECKRDRNGIHYTRRDFCKKAK
jgi:hypothetical protein